MRPGESGAAFDSAGFGTDLPPLVLIVLIALGASTLAVAHSDGAPAPWWSQTWNLTLPPLGRAR